MTDLAVIIPYYQTKPGLLRRAVNSVLSQRVTSHTQIVIVDDASPNPGGPEIEDLLQNQLCKITILHRTNGGAGAARNTGLDYVTGKVTHVAFLDSDDIFEPSHLLKMKKAFSAGAEFYFCNTKRPASSESSFMINGFPRGSIDVLCRQHEIFWYRDPLISLNLTQAPYGTNSIGYRLTGHEHIRFATEFRRACEDRLFVAELARDVKHVAFSTACDVNLGTGVNIFAGSTWGTSKAVICMLDTTRFHLRLGGQFSLSDEDRRRNKICLTSCDRNFWANTVVCTMKSGQPPLREVREYLRLRPNSYCVLPATILALLKMKLTKASGHEPSPR